MIAEAEDADGAEDSATRWRMLTGAPDEIELVAKLDENTTLAESFADLGLSDAILDATKAAGYVQPTPIQSMMIPRAMTGRDVMGQARTGTGKTAAFLLPIFSALTLRLGRIQALILAPTRELAPGDSRRNPQARP